MGQTVVLSTEPVASPGDLADLHTAADGDIISAVNSESTASLIVGTMVKVGSAAGTALKLTSSHEGSKMLGVVVRGHAHTTPDEIDAVEVVTDVYYDGLKPGVPIGIVRSGRVAVIIEEDVAFSDAVHVRCVTDTGKFVGTFGKTDGGNYTAQLTNCRYCGDYEADDVTGFGVAIVEINPGFGPLSVTDS